MFDLVCYLDGNLLCHLGTTICKTSSGCFFLSPYHFRHLRQDAAHRESHNCTDSWTSASCFGDSQASLSSSESLSIFASEKSQQMSFSIATVSAFNLPTCRLPNFRHGNWSGSRHSSHAVSPPSQCPEGHQSKMPKLPAVHPAGHQQLVRFILKLDANKMTGSCSGDDPSNVLACWLQTRFTPFQHD